MFSHVNIGSNDLVRSKIFYDAVLNVIGVKTGIESNFNSPRIIYQHNRNFLIITTPLNGQIATTANGGTIGFLMNSPEQVEKFHTTALSCGGTTCEEPPGERHTPFGTIYLAYVRDPDGNKLCACYQL
ncbi:VOC family protein [Acinetobacter guillouiae]|uniref:VOC family protein n=1 Tax=Acinetobacter guillouiae TaxID=106649 RepID=UPI002FD98F89